MSVDKAYLDSILAKRGFSIAPEHFRLHPYEYYTAQGWVYPVTTLAGVYAKTENDETVVRFKNKDSKAKPKYAWPRGQGEAKYYGATAGFHDTVSQYGWLGITSGEPDTWTMAEVGFGNCLNWFGEASLPKTLVEDVRSFNVERLLIWPDNDETGRLFAAKIYELLHDVIQISAYTLPDGKGYDLNRLWQDSKFDAATFKNTLRYLPPMDLEAVYQDYQECKRQAPTAPAPFKSGEINPAIQDALRRAALAESRGKERGGKIPILSPLSHKNDEPGQHCTYYVENCSAWEFSRNQWIGGLELCAHWNINVEALGGFFSGDRYEKTRKVEKTQNNPTLSVPKPKPDEMESWYTSTRQQSVSVMAELNGEKLPEGRPIRGIIPALREFGGFAAWHWTRKIVLFIGGTGLGKTSLLNDIFDNANRDGISGVLYTPEWTPNEWVYRDLIRYGGGITFEELAANQAAAWQHSRGEELSNGATFLSERKVNMAKEVLGQLQTWPGELFLVKNPSLVPSQLFDLLRYLIPTKRAEGYKMDLVGIDYVQAVADTNKTANEWSAYTQFLKDFKDVCEEIDVLGIVTSQARKDDDQRMRDGKTLSGNMAMGLRTDAANLVITLNPEFDNSGNILETATMATIKNSMGRTGVKRHMPTNFEMLSWGI